MSTNRHLAPGVDTTLLKAHFLVVRGAVVALIFPVKSNKFLPTVDLVRSFSSFIVSLFILFCHMLLFIFWGLCFGNENDCICIFYHSDTLG